MIVNFPTDRARNAEPDTDMALPQYQRLARVLTLTQDMVALAEAGDWDAVAAREQDRRDDLARCFKEAVSTEHAELVAEALAAILHLNEEMMAHLSKARDAVLQQGVAQVRTRSAIGHYERVKSQP
ncbi:MAG TPA: flagellar protein FliT [Haliea salexigens]|uniref:Flagellar protein FliT n=1 Tax=Haliea salexigens TaxID=287487 RepID=A0A3C1KNE7_9GAMM|nr:flagellar protein FliT [Haliea salexigens]HAN27983.1 flagellar protein FliT [Haliea salexigens]|tara:strand:+ start:3650 stop:4027 length:378 start_codon:yes stop_codon:yes gene_type:complete